MSSNERSSDDVGDFRVPRPTTSVSSLRRPKAALSSLAAPSASIKSSLAKKRKTLPVTSSLTLPKNFSLSMARRLRAPSASIISSPASSRASSGASTPTSDISPNNSRFSTPVANKRVAGAIRQPQTFAPNSASKSVPPSPKVSSSTDFRGTPKSPFGLSFVRSRSLSSEHTPSSPPKLDILEEDTAMSDVVDMDTTFASSVMTDVVDGEDTVLESEIDQSFLSTNDENKPPTNLSHGEVKWAQAYLEVEELEKETDFLKAKLLRLKRELRAMQGNQNLPPVFHKVMAMLDDVGSTRKPTLSSPHPSETSFNVDVDASPFSKSMLDDVDESFRGNAEHGDLGERDAELSLGGPPNTAEWSASTSPVPWEQVQIERRRSTKIEKVSFSANSKFENVDLTSDADLLKFDDEDVDVDAGFNEDVDVGGEMESNPFATNRLDAI